VTDGKTEENLIVVALRSSEGQAAIAEAVRAALRQEREEQPAPLWVILGISPGAARTRVSRDLQLRKLGIIVGRRLLFRRAEVLEYMKSRGR